jgi:hypothetical protein
MCDVKIVSIDSRGKATSDAECYKEHTASLELFYKKIAKHPQACRIKSEVAALCGLDMTVYFHCIDEVFARVEDNEEINHAASMLTMDASAGFAKHHIRGVAYVVMNDGLAPLSWNQVWGIVELACDASSYFEYDSRGQKELTKLTYLYRKQSYGPLSIYKSREETANKSVAHHNYSFEAEHTRKPKSLARKPFSSLQV